MASIGSIQDMWWYWIKLDGEKKKIAYCNPELCVFDNCCNSTFQSRLRIKGATLELTNVRKEDRGLQLHCQIFPKLKGRMTSERTAQFYWIKIIAVMPKGQSTILFHRSWVNVRGTQRQFSENICSEDDLRSRIF